MECPVCISDLYKTCDKLQVAWSELSILLSETINSLESSLLSSDLKELSLDVKDCYPLTSNRDVMVEKMKVSVIHETLNSLKLLYNNFERWNGIVERRCGHFNRMDMHGKLASKIEQLLYETIETFDLLNNNGKSPYNLEAILDPDYFIQSLKTHPIKNEHDRARLFIGLAQTELEIMKESSKTNEMQKVILTLHIENLKAFGDQVATLSTISTESLTEKKSKSSKPSKSKETNKICEIMRKCQRLIKDVYGLMKIATFKDYFNESDEIFNIINEKGSDAILEVRKFIESKKQDCINWETENTTRSTCRSGALRRLNTILKLLKKLNLLRHHFESSCIVLGLKNIVNDTLKIYIDFKNVHCTAYYLTFKVLPKPRVDVPDNFLRNDPVYEEIYRRPFDGFFIVYVHVSIFDAYLETIDWNPCQFRKPKKLQYYLSEIFDTIKYAYLANFNQDESCQISLDLADRYLMTKQKIEYDRDALALRFDRFKPLKPYKFTEIHKILNSQRSSFIKRYKLMSILEEKFDVYINKLNKKVTNRGQLIVFERAMAMMKRSMKTLSLLRCDLYGELVEQAANEYLYAVEIVVKLLDLLRPNRRITFSFSANGPYINKIDSIGLKVKDEFLETVNSQIKTLKDQIKNKEADLETVKEEKTQLKYLQSILTRTKAVPIQELEMTDKDNIVILREIIEEFEFTNIQYG